MQLSHGGCSSWTTQHLFHSNKERFAQTYTWGGSARLFYFFLVAGPVRNAPERSWHASGPIFRPNRQFWTRFGPFLMIWAQPDIFGGTWTSRTRPGTGLEAQDQARDWLGGPGPGQGLARRPWPSQAILFFSHEIKKKRFFFIFGGGSATPRQTGKSQTFFLFGGGQIPGRHFWLRQKCRSGI